ncbi:MAG: glycerol-3-phosphate 1-O-acyltransferase PlsY [Elusimicrobiota bacterium]
MDILAVSLVALSYFLGGVPSGYIIARRVRGIDIRKHGSGNPGTANVYRSVGRKAGLLTLAADALKGFLPVYLAIVFYPEQQAVSLLCGAMAIIGHVWTVFLNFGGGKGVATTAGVFLALLPRCMGPAAIIFFVAMGLSGHISVGSMTTAAVFPFLALMAGSPPAYTALAFASSSLILYKHIPNLRKLLRERAQLEKHG